MNGSQGTIGSRPQRYQERDLAAMARETYSTIDRLIEISTLGGITVKEVTVPGCVHMRLRIWDFQQSPQARESQSEAGTMMRLNAYIEEDRPLYHLCVQIKAENLDMPSR